MKQAAFGQAVQALFAQHEKLITRRNSRIAGGNGVFSRCECPVLTAADAPIRIGARERAPNRVVSLA